MQSGPTRPGCVSIQAKLVVGAQGLPVLIAIVREGHTDLDMLRGALECLALVMSHLGSQAEGLGKVRPRAAALKGDGNCIAHPLTNLNPLPNIQSRISGNIARVCMCLQVPQSAAINAEVFSRGTDNIQSLLGLLAYEPADFYVQYHTVRLLTCLATVSSLRVQEVCTAILTYASIVRVVKLFIA